MKRITALLAAIACCAVSYAQDAQSAAAAAAAALTQAPQEEVKVEKPTYWTTTAAFRIGFDQTGLWNWAAGGYNTISLATGVNASANYAKDLVSWANSLKLDYGFLWSADKKNLLQKNMDQIYLESKLAYKTGKDSKWNYTASLGFRSQFTDSYVDYVEKDGKWQGTLKSGFLAPAYTDLGFGMEWKPNGWFNMNLAPVTGSVTIVTNPELRATYGMKALEDGSYKSALFQFGAQLKVNAKVSINDVFVYDTQVVLFTNYLDHPFAWNRVNWDNRVTWKIAKFFNIAFNTWLIYDPIVTIDGVMSKTQFKEFLQLSFIYTLSNKKK